MWNSGMIAQRWSIPLDADHIWPTELLQVLSFLHLLIRCAFQISREEVSLATDFDVAIVGSGFGGAVAACLAELPSNSCQVRPVCSTTTDCRGGDKPHFRWLIQNDGWERVFAGYCTALYYNRIIIRLWSRKILEPVTWSAGAF